jgi:hypothetical protein
VPTNRPLSLPTIPTKTPTPIFVLPFANARAVMVLFYCISANALHRNLFHPTSRLLIPKTFLLPFQATFGNRQKSVNEFLMFC